MTPMTGSLIGDASTDGQTRAIRDLGLVVDSDFTEPGAFGTGVFGGYLYGNLSLIRVVSERVPGMSAGDADRQIAGLSDDAPAHRPQPGDRSMTATMRGTSGDGNPTPAARHLRGRRSPRRNRPVAGRTSRPHNTIRRRADRVCPFVPAAVLRRDATPPAHLRFRSSGRLGDGTVRRARRRATRNHDHPDGRARHDRLGFTGFQALGPRTEGVGVSDVVGSLRHGCRSGGSRRSCGRSRRRRVRRRLRFVPGRPRCTRT